MSLGHIKEKEGKPCCKVYCKSTRIFISSGIAVDIDYRPYFCLKKKVS